MPLLRSVVLTLFAAAATIEAADFKCADGLKMFVSRGTGEPMGLGVTEKVVKSIAKRIEGSDYEAIMYPASFEKPTYEMSVQNGTKMVREAMMGYATACPDSKMAWFGYSQGAQITSNNLCGSSLIWPLGSLSGELTEDRVAEIVTMSQPIPSNYTENIVSVVLFGDTTHTNTSSYNYGDWNNTGNGVFYRPDESGCEALGPRLRSYCDAGDPFCDVGPTFTNAHVLYVERHHDEVVDFVVSQYKNREKKNLTTSTSHSPSPTAAPEPNRAVGLSPTMSGLVLAALLMAAALV